MKELIWEITDDCLNQCIHCSSCLPSDGISRHLKVVTPETLRSVAGRFKEHGFSRIVLSGGEPMLHPDIAAILNSLHALDYHIGIYTSGVYQNNFYNSIGKEALKLISCVFVSFYSHDKDIHNSITQNASSYDLALQSISYYRELGLYIEANIVPMQLNQAHLFDTAEFLKTIGVSKVNILKLVKQGSAENNWQSIQTNILPLTDQISALSASSDVRVGNPFGTQKTGGQQCGAGHEKVCVTFDGYVIPCEVFKNGRRLFPNIYDVDFDCNATIQKYASLQKVVTSGKSGCYYNEICKHLDLSEVAA